jgi:predicted O-methyltransferase YrrM
MTKQSKITRLIKRLVLKVSHRVDPYFASIDITDEYTRWLNMAVAGWMVRGNLHCFDYAIRNLPSNAPILEIGSFQGLSTNLIAYYRRMHNAPNLLITCDKWEFEDRQGPMLADSGISHQDYRDFIRASFKRNIEMFSRADLPHTVEMTSDEFFEAARQKKEVQDIFGRKLSIGGPISFCFIDGNHTYEFAKRDYENTDAFLEPGGFILFDDSADGSDWGVCRVVREVRASGKYDLVIKNPNYLFQKKP